MTNRTCALLHCCGNRTSTEHFVRTSVLTCNHFFAPSFRMREIRNQSATEATLEPVVSKLERFVLYETTSHFYLTASDKRETQYRVLKIDRRVVNPMSLADICQEDPVVYTPIDMIEMLDMINEGNRTVGGLRMTAKGYGIVGFAKFLDCYYLNFITQRRLVSPQYTINTTAVAVRASILQLLYKCCT